VVELRLVVAYGWVVAQNYAVIPPDVEEQLVRMLDEESRFVGAFEAVESYDLSHNVERLLYVPSDPARDKILRGVLRLSIQVVLNKFLRVSQH
jgi:hypothetical protein